MQVEGGILRVRPRYPDSDVDSGGSAGIWSEERSNKSKCELGSWGSEICWQAQVALVVGGEWLVAEGSGGRLWA